MVIKLTWAEAQTIERLGEKWPEPLSLSPLGVQWAGRVNSFSHTCSLPAQSHDAADSPQAATHGEGRGAKRLVLHMTQITACAVQTTVSTSNIRQVQVQGCDVESLDICLVWWENPASGTMLAY